MGRHRMWRGDNDGKKSRRTQRISTIIRPWNERAYPKLCAPQDGKTHLWGKTRSACARCLNQNNNDRAFAGRQSVALATLSVRANARLSELVLKARRQTRWGIQGVVSRNCRPDDACEDWETARKATRSNERLGSPQNGANRANNKYGHSQPITRAKIHLGVGRVRRDHERTVRAKRRR